MGFIENLGNQIGSRLGLGSQAGKSAYEDTGNDWKKLANDYANKWSHVADFTDANGNPTATGQRFNELSGLYTGEVDKGAAQAGEATAGAYSRRGMGDSGYATGAQQNVMMQAAQARAQAREAAREAAVGEQEGILGAETQTALSPYASLFNAAAQRYMQGQAQNTAFNNQQAQTEEEWFQNMGKSMMGSGMGGG